MSPHILRPECEFGGGISAQRRAHRRLHYNAISVDVRALEHTTHAGALTQPLSRRKKLLQRISCAFHTTTPTTSDESAGQECGKSFCMRRVKTFRHAMRSQMRGRCV